MARSELYLRDLREGQESGLHHFTTIYGKPLRFFAYSLVRNKEVADDTYTKKPVHGVPCVFQEKLCFMPIPQREMEKNLNLIQNNGW